MVSAKTIRDPRGCLTTVENLPFAVKRIYFLHGITGPRGGHAHRELDRIFIAAAGSFTVKSNGIENRLFMPDEPLRVRPMTWIELTDFSHGAICLVLASEEYSEADYIRDPAEFNQLTGMDF